MMPLAQLSSPSFFFSRSRSFLFDVLVRQVHNGMSPNTYYVRAHSIYTPNLHSWFKFWIQKTARPRDVAFIRKQNQELHKLYNFAYSTLTGCTRPAQLFELDGVLLDILIRRPGPYPCKSDLLASLAKKLVSKYSSAGQPWAHDLSDGFLLRLDTLDRWRSSDECTVDCLDQQFQPLPEVSKTTYGLENLNNSQVLFHNLAEKSDFI